MKKIIVLVMALASFFGCKQTNVLKSLDASKNYSVQEVKAGEEFEIKLSANPSTGYAWNLGHDLDKKMLKLIDNKYVQNNNPEQMVGVGGTETWKFKALKSGKAYIHMVYKRGDEPAKEEQFFEVTIQ